MEIILTSYDCPGMIYLVKQLTANRSPTMTTAERRELRDDLKTEIEEIDADVFGWRCEIQALKEQIDSAKRHRVELIARRNALKTANT